jgi:low affinity Fe/Cu permease
MMPVNTTGEQMTRTRKRSRLALEPTADRIAGTVTHWAGSSWGFGMALGTVIVWAITGPLFRWSDTWQLVINTGTTIATFLMVFLVQRTQNRDGLAIQLKLNELVAAVQGASNRLIDVEDLSEQELKTIQAHYRRLVEMAQHDQDVAASHSVEEAEQRHLTKRGSPRRSQTDGGDNGGAKKRATSSSA